MQLYVRNMQVICNYMSEICKKYAQYIDCISQIWKKYALNMPEICTNMQIICSYMLKICSYMPKICNKYAQYIDCISRICKKYAAKICRNMQFICKICISLYIAYIAFICTPHFADGATMTARSKLRGQRRKLQSESQVTGVNALP